MSGEISRVLCLEHGRQTWSFHPCEASALHQGPSMVVRVLFSHVGWAILDSAAGSHSRGRDNFGGEATWLLPVHFWNSILCMAISPLLSPQLTIHWEAPSPRHDPPFAKEHPTHPQSQETLFVLLNLLYKQKLRFLFCFSTLPRRGPTSDSSRRSIFPRLHTTASHVSQPTSVSAANPSTAWWEGTVSTKLSFSGHLCII